MRPSGASIVLSVNTFSTMVWMLLSTRAASFVLAASSTFRRSILVSCALAAGIVIQMLRTKFRVSSVAATISSRTTGRTRIFMTVATIVSSVSRDSSATKARNFAKLASQAKKPWLIGQMS
jgi:hypothetical protein